MVAWKRWVECYNLGAVGQGVLGWVWWMGELAYSGWGRVVLGVEDESVVVKEWWLRVC